MGNADAMQAVWANFNINEFNIVSANIVSDSIGPTIWNIRGEYRPHKVKHVIPKYIETKQLDKLGSIL